MHAYAGQRRRVRNGRKGRQASPGGNASTRVSRDAEDESGARFKFGSRRGCNYSLGTELQARHIYSFCYIRSSRIDLLKAKSAAFERRVSLFTQPVSQASCFQALKSSAAFACTAQELSALRSEFNLLSEDPSPAFADQNNLHAPA
jgi:hypothetical protein